MATTSDIKKGLTIEFNNDLFKVVEFLHVKPGKGPAFVRTKLKSITTGKVIDNTFSASAKLSEVRIERRPYQYLYKDDLGYHFMHKETYEQINIEEQLIEGAEFYKESIDVEIIFHADKELPLSCELPPFVILEVKYTEPGLRGDTASSTATKPAKLETGAEIKVPLFIETGEKIKVDTRSGEYVERAK